MSGINKVIILGNLGNDPEIKATAAGKAVANFSIATSEKWKDKQTGQQQEKTEWHRVVVFDRLAEIVSDYVKSGSKVYVEGKLQTRKWKDKDGNDRYTTEIVANELQMLDSRESSQPAKQAPKGKNQAMQSGLYTPVAPSHGETFDDDIPF